MKLRRPLAVTAILAAGILTIPFTASQAHAGVADMTCGGTTTAHYSPGVTTTSVDQHVTMTDEYTPCVSPGNPAITSGIFQGSYDAPVSCEDLLDTTSGTHTITWNTGQTSTYSFNFAAIVILGEVIYTETGSVTSGLFSGDTVLIVGTRADTDIAACLSLGTPITSQAGTLTLEFTSI